jgi:hypothetical protein
MGSVTSIMGSVVLDMGFAIFLWDLSFFDGYLGHVSNEIAKDLLPCVLVLQGLSMKATDHVIGIVLQSIISV